MELVVLAAVICALGILGLGMVVGMTIRQGMHGDARERLQGDTSLATADELDAIDRARLSPSEADRIYLERGGWNGMGNR